MAVNSLVAVSAKPRPIQLPRITTVFALHTKWFPCHVMHVLHTCKSNYPSNAFPVLKAPRLSPFAFLRRLVECYRQGKIEVLGKKNSNNFSFSITNPTWIILVIWITFNALNPELNPICYLLALLGAHHFLHVSRIRVKILTFRRLMSHIYGAPILDVSRSHTTTQHSR